MTENCESVFLYENRSVLSAEQIMEKGFRIKAYCEENGYLPGGSLSISEPMSRSGSELKWIADYCHNRGIAKIVVDSLRDVGKTSAEVQNVSRFLCTQGFCMEVADCCLTFAAGKEASAEPDEDQGLTMGGM